MKTRYFLFKVIPLALCILLTACSAEDGETGPQGPQGEQGEIGPQGEQGPPGQDISSNVISSGWFGIDTWERDLARVKVHTIFELTDFQLENGVILIYRKQQPSPSVSFVEILPITFTVGSSGDFLVTRMLIEQNNLQIVIESFGFDVRSEDYLPPETEFRYIILEPPSTADKDTTVNFSKMSYDEVIDYLGLDP